MQDVTFVEDAPSRRYRAVVLGLLLLVYALNFLDRQLMGILATPIKHDLALSDSQLGALNGIAFALLYATMAIPLAMLADRTNRTRVIAVSLAVWSGFTALCGVAGTTMQLFLFRLGVGVGEAGGVAPSYAVITEYFAPHERARALAIYSLGVPLGSAAGVLFGSYITHAVNWRGAFIVMGLIGLVVTPIFRLVVKEPRRSHDMTGAAPVSTVFRLLARKPAFWLLSAGGASNAMAVYGVGFWLPSVIQRSFGLDLVHTGQFLGALLMLGGVSGVLLGGWLGDRLGGRDRAAYAWLPAAAYLVAAPLFLAGFMSTSATLAFVLLLVPQAMISVWLGPVLTAVQHLVPAHMRASASACFLLIVNLFGLGLGSWLIGTMSDALTPRFGTEALRYAVSAALALYLVAGVFDILAGKQLRKDWVA